MNKLISREIQGIFTIVLFLLSTYYKTQAQAPQGIPYQAIARNASGVAIASTAVKVRFSIRDSIATGAIKYQETHNRTTSALGLFSVNVGMGTVVSGTFSGINWGKNAKFLQVEMDPAGGTTYTDLGTTQMMSVPYALFSVNSLTTSNTFSNRLFFSQSGSWKVPKGVSKIKIQLWAGSGGGGASFASPQSPVTRNGGQSGGSGGYVEKHLYVNSDSIIPIVIGNGGQGGIPRSSNGGDGGNSIFGNIIASGGLGGITASFQSATFPPAASSGLIDLNISDGGTGEVIPYLSLPDYLKNGQLKIFSTPGGSGPYPGDYIERPGENGTKGFLIVSY